MDSNQSNFQKECPFCWYEYSRKLEACPKCNTVIPSIKPDKTFVAEEHKHPPGKGLQRDVY